MPVSRAAITWVTALVFVVTLPPNLLVYASISHIPIVGKSFVQHQKEHDPLGYVYVVLGEPITIQEPFQDLGLSLAESLGEHAWKKIRVDPTLIKEVLSGEAWRKLTGVLRLIYWATPISLALLIGLYLSRPKKITLGR